MQTDFYTDTIRWYRSVGLIPARTFPRCEVCEDIPGEGHDCDATEERDGIPCCRHCAEVWDECQPVTEEARP